MTVRGIVGLFLGAVAAGLGGLILGEYQFTGYLPWLAGPLFGIVIAEVVVATGKARSRLSGVLAGAFASAGLGWAAWISTGSGLRPFPTVAWPAMALALAAAVAWTGGATRPTRSTRVPADR